MLVHNYIKHDFQIKLTNLYGGQYL